MSDLRFFMTHSDTEEFVSWLITQFRATFVPASHPTSAFPTFTTSAEISRYIAERQHPQRFFVLSDIWQVHPLSTSQTRHNDGTSAYYVDQRYGGPAFDFVLSRPAASGAEVIIGGLFGDYASYYVRRDSADSFPRPTGMADAFRAAQNYMRRAGRRTVSAELGHAGGWALRGALAAHAAGAWLRLGDFHFHPTESPNQALQRTGSAVTAPASGPPPSPTPPRRSRASSAGR
jgi:hypothetical protein